MLHKCLLNINEDTLQDLRWHNAEQVLMPVIPNMPAAARVRRDRLAETGKSAITIAICQGANEPGF